MKQHHKVYRTPYNLKYRGAMCATKDCFNKRAYGIMEICIKCQNTIARNEKKSAVKIDSPTGGVNANRRLDGVLWKVKGSRIVLPTEKQKHTTRKAQWKAHIKAKSTKIVNRKVSTMNDTEFLRLMNN